MPPPVPPSVKLGLSTQGNWRVHATDEAGINTGTLQSWSLIVTD